MADAFIIDTCRTPQGIAVCFFHQNNHFMSKNHHVVNRCRYYMSGLKSPQIRHWLMSALRGKADITLMSAMGQKRTLDDFMGNSKFNHNLA